MDGARNGQAELSVVRNLWAQFRGEDGLFQDRKVREAPDQRRVGVEPGPDGRQGRVNENLTLAGHAGEELDEIQRSDRVAGERADREIRTAQGTEAGAVRPR